MIALMAAGFIVDLGVKAYAQQVKRREAQKKEESFRRPEPSRPIRPEIPSANRYRQDKVFLEYADSLFKVNNYRDTTERQIVKGKVKFRQAGMWMFCDSAYYYPNLNSLDAFGHVRMEQGDTLFVYSDKLYYNGNERLARLKNGPSCEKVRLINRDVTLTTDSLDYDLAMDLGWYDRWGKIDDKVNTLTSLYGEYSPATKNAEFFNDVVLVNNDDGYTLLTDTLYYSTATHIARIESETEIQGANDTIVTTRGFYDTNQGNAELLSRSMIIHRDSSNNVTTLEGDSIIYDKVTRISRAYMFRDPNRKGMPMVITDTAHRTTLIGGFGTYNDSTQEALACEYPMLMEYSQGDTLFLRSDTIKTYIYTAMVPASRRWTASGFPEYKRKPIIMADGMVIWIDPVFFSLVAPMKNKATSMLEKVTPRKAETPASGSSHPQIPEKVNPLEEMSIAQSIVEDNEQIVDRSMLENRIGEQPAPQVADSLSAKMAQAVVEVEDKDSVPLLPKEFHIALAYHRARFFKKDLQGVADSMVVVEQDSMLYMFRRPIVWTGERQVTGNRIDVHFNDSTADWAFLPESGLLSEHVGEDLYNQLAGKKMLATFANETLKKLEVSGNVQTIFLPQESDSTYTRLVTAESSYLTLEMDSNQIKKLKMWPETTGSVIPLFLLKKSQQYLAQFRWWDAIRPMREYVDGKMKWQDQLGEVSDELEMYFNSPSDFGAPKSYPEFRPSPVSNPVSSPVSSPVAPADAEKVVKDVVVTQEEIESIRIEESSMKKEEETAIKEGDSIETEPENPEDADKAEADNVEAADDIEAEDSEEPADDMEIQEKESTDNE